MGQLVKGGLLKPLDAYAEATTAVNAGRGRCSTSTASLPTASSSAAATSTASRSRARSSACSTTRPRSKTPSEDVRGSRGDARQGEAGRRDADRVRQPRQVRRHPRVPDRPEPVHAQELDAQLRVRQERLRRFDTAENRDAAAKLQDWANKGYFTKDFNGVGYDPAWQQFVKGKGPFTIAGTWITFDALKGLGDKLGFFLMPGREAGSDPGSLGGESLPWGITSKSKNADVAAAYLDFITNQKAADVQVETDNLPAVQPSVTPTTPVQKEIFAAWKRLSDTDGLTPYMDYATPTFFDDFSGAVQRLLGGKLTPEQFTKGVQEDYAKFTDTL